MSALLEIQFPAGGLHEGHGYRQQAPYTSPRLLNVRPKGVLEKRARGGSRPGLGKAFYEELGSGNPIRLMEQVTVSDPTGFAYWLDTFQGVLDPVWSTASWIGTDLEILPYDLSTIEYLEEGGLVRAALPIDSGQAYSVEMFVAPWHGEYHGTFSLFARMDDTTPVGTTDGIVVTLEMTGKDGDYDGTLDEYTNGVKTSHAFTAAGSIGSATAGWLKVLISADNVKVYWQGNELFGGSGQAVTSHSGLRVGLGSECSEAGGLCLIEAFRAQYYSTAIASKYRTILVASADGEVWEENTLGEMVKRVDGSAVNLAGDRPLQAVERGQRIYIADNGEVKVEGTDGTIAAGGTDLTAVGVSDWRASATGIDTDNDVCVISDGQGDVVDNTYPIDSLEEGKLVLDLGALPLTNGGGACSYRIERGPKVYDPSDNSLAIWQTDQVSGDTNYSKGQVPTGCRIISRYRDRLVLGGNPTAPHLWYMSRQGDPADFDYSETDAGAAVAGASTEAGTIGEPITAIIPHTDDFCVFGCANTVWVLRGDASASGGGQIDVLDKFHGIVPWRAWCRGPGGSTVFLSPHGLCYLGPGAESVPEMLSKDIPQHLQNVDPTRYTVLLEFDPAGPGVHVFLTATGGEGTLHWWFDWTYGSFFPETYQSDHEPTATIRYRSDCPIESGVLLGCKDGYIRRYDDLFETDDGEVIPSEVLLCLIRAGGSGYHEGIVETVTGVLGRNSGSVHFEILAGETHEEAVQADAEMCAEWEAGRNRTTRPQVRCGSFGLLLVGGQSILLTQEGFPLLTQDGQYRLTQVNEDYGRWAMESVSVTVRKTGMHRKG